LRGGQVGSNVGGKLVRVDEDEAILVRFRSLLGTSPGIDATSWLADSRTSGCIAAT
jgi:hypothetical protein